MTIALVSQEYPPETAKGGIGTQTYIKAHGLSAMGHKIYVLSRSTDDTRHVSEDGRVTIIRVPGYETAIPEMTDIVQWLSYSMLVAAELETLQQRESLDLIDFPEWAAEGFVYLLNRTSWKCVPVAIHLHGPLVMFGQTMGWPEISSPFFQTGTHMEAACVRLADAVYSSSACSAQWIRDWYRPEVEEIPIIHMGIDTNNYLPADRHYGDDPTIVFAGRIVPNKGVLELLEAAAILSGEFPGLRLKMLGHGDEGLIRQMKARANELRASELLIFEGFIPKEDLPRFLSQADVFAAPSHYEGGPGFVYLEAMACGIPVIGCLGSGVSEIINNGENGFLIPPGDIAALTHALRCVLIDPELRMTMGLNARSYVKEHADSRDCLHRLEIFYRSVVEKAKVQREGGMHG